MTPNDAEGSEEREAPESDDSEEEYGADYLNWKPLTPEDFGPGEEWFRDVFFAWREEFDEEDARADDPHAGEQRPEPEKGPS